MPIRFSNMVDLLENLFGLTLFRVITQNAAHFRTFSDYMSKFIFIITNRTGNTSRVQQFSLFRVAQCFQNYVKFINQCTARMEADSRAVMPNDRKVIANWVQKLLGPAMCKEKSPWMHSDLW